eukprot:gnl/Spiro4/16135_TR8672_c0_g1_i1.p1 gnl/Spiro4/16135_TR8672_c0_g1~~gnl/Spiro4/16135_TR8672_c0_g1_i1.p1  ORF type:complete len:445 (+),score=63.23 gnl/Spiro4/16135_TR8672_c0_g1_i1:27-1337(+)
MFSSRRVCCDVFAKRALELPASGIREIFELASKLESTRRVIHLEVGQPNFPPPPHVLEATTQALHGGATKYIGNAGLAELRAQLPLFFDRFLSPSSTALPTRADQVMVTTGSMGALYSTFRALLNPGDQVLVPFPGFTNHAQSIALAYGVALPYRLHPSSGWVPRIEELEDTIARSSKRLKALLVVSPSNPCGSVAPRETMSAICELARRHNLWLISDEIYGGLILSPETHQFTSSVEFEGDRAPETSKLVVISGVSKMYAMTGFRTGFVRGPPALIRLLTKLQEPIVSCGVPFAQFGALAAVKGPQECVAEMSKAYRDRRDRALEIIARDLPSAQPQYKPPAAFYLPVSTVGCGLSSRDFALQLLKEEGVAVAPGTSFDPRFPFWGEGVVRTRDSNGEAGDECVDFVRVSLASSGEQVCEGVEKLCAFLRRLRRK